MRVVTCPDGKWEVAWQEKVGRDGVAVVVVVEVVAKVVVVVKLWRVRWW